MKSAMRNTALVLAMAFAAGTSYALFDPGHDGGDGGGGAGSGGGGGGGSDFVGNFGGTYVGCSDDACDAPAVTITGSKPIESIDLTITTGNGYDDFTIPLGSPIMVGGTGGGGGGGGQPTSEQQEALHKKKKECTDNCQLSLSSDNATCDSAASIAQGIVDTVAGVAKIGGKFKIPRLPKLGDWSGPIYFYGTAGVSQLSQFCKGNASANFVSCLADCNKP